ncbi:MAG: MFS transporter [Gammaproteobacteria bacterium]|nr:MFS transporter [Gammaproteobacteria bacterium]
MTADPRNTRQNNLLQRVLGLEREEYLAVAWSFVYFFCVLAAYYILRSVRETMAVEGGVQNIPWLFSGTFAVMLLATPIFGWVASRYPRKRFLPWVYYFFVVNILLFYAGFSYAIHIDHDFVWLGRAFFVWLSIFNLFVVSVFWSFMADIYTHEQGRRLFGLISAGGSAGALLGPLVTSALVVPIGFQNLLPISAVLLLCGVYCIAVLRHWVESRDGDAGGETVASSRPLGGNALGGVQHVARSQYLSSIALASIIASLMGSALYIFMAQLVGEAFTDTDERTRVFALIDAATNTLALIGQLFIVKHAVRHLGIGITLSLLPFVSLVGFALLAINPVFAVVAVLQLVRRSLGFGLSKPTNDMLYSVVTPEEKYKAKNFIDTALYRGGDLIGVWAVRFMSGLGISGVSLVMLPFAILWAGIALWLGRDYRRRDRLGIGETKA